jgi:hypothetical protein
MSLKQLLRACAIPFIGIAAASWGAAAQPADVSAAAPLPAVFNKDGGVQLPTGYRRWQHVGARVKTGGNSVLDGSKIKIPQLMNAYVEPRAFDIYRATGEWPQGTQIVKEFSSIKTGKDCSVSSFICSTPYGFGIFETRFIGLGMMVKDSQRFPAETGHWGYFSFLLDGQHYASVSPVRARFQCSSCHEALAAATDYVFSDTHIGLLPENLH